MFNPTEKLTTHDVEVQLHTIEAIITTLRKKNETTVNVVTLERLLEMGTIQLSQMTKDGES